MESAGQHSLPSETADEPPPLYTETKQDVSTTISQILDALGDIEKARLPLLTSPTLQGLLRRRSIEDGNLFSIIETYFGAIATGNVELASAFLGAGLVTTETKSQKECTPLLTAIESEQTHMARYLLDIGADINAYGVTERLCSIMRRGRQVEEKTYRTPLQYAAQVGNLPIVKLLVERGADDAMIAPDGQLALRLAASNGHREVVEYLPSRRGGGFKRWKTKHATAMRRCKRATRKIYEVGKLFAWDLPKFFLWSIPKHVLVLPLIESVKWIREHWHDIPRMVADTGKKMLEQLSRFLPRAWSATKDLPQVIWKLLAKCVHRALEAIRGIPHATKIALLWLWRQIMGIARGIGRAVELSLSSIHTMCAAVLSFFQRITLQDIISGLKAFFHALLIDLPMRIWNSISSVGEVSRRILIAIFGGCGKCIWFLVELFVSGAFYIPAKLIEVLSACGSSASNGGKEIMVWFNPKTV